MIRFKSKLHPLTLSALSLVAPHLVAAQSSTSVPPQGASEQDLEEVVVTGYRSVLVESQALKRESTSIVEALTAEDIGKLPDTSIAESLARLPGLAGERRNGRSSGLSVRGFREDYVGATMNGRELLGMGDNRGVEYDLYPAEIVGSAVVYKAPDASLITQGIGGTVDLRTTRPLESEPAIALNGNYEVNDLSSANADYDDTGHRVSFSFSDRFADEKVGIAITAATMESPSQEEQFRGWGYADVNSTNATVGPGVTLQGNEVILGGQDSFARSAVMERDSVAAVLQFAPTDRVALTLDGLYIDFDENKVFRGLEEGGAEWGTPDYSITDVQDGFVTAGSYDGFRSVIRNDAESTQAKLKTFGLNVAFKLTDQLSLVVDGSTGDVEKSITNIESYSGVGRPGTAQGPAAPRSFVMTPEGARYSAHPTLSSLDYTDRELITLAGPQPWGGALAPVDAFQPNFDTAQDGFVNRPDFEESLDAGRLQLNGELDFPVVKSYQVGAHYAERSKTKMNSGAFLTAPTWPGDGAIPEGYVVGTTGLDFIGLGSIIAYDSMGLYRDGYYVETDAGRYETGRQGDSYTVDEKLTTLFVKADLDVELFGSPLTGNVGVQWVETDQSSSGFNSVIGADLEVVATPVTDGDKYSKVLPSLNLNYEVRPGHMVRLAAAKTMSRPRMDDLRSSSQVAFSFNDGTILDGSTENSPWSGSSGNPQLRPLEANQFDVAYEFYFANDGLVSLGFFYKDLVNWHRSAEVVVDFTPFYIPGYHQSSAQTGNQPPATFLGTVASREDGLEGFVRGWEFQASFPFRLIHTALEGAGLVFSAALSEGELDDDNLVPGLSDEAYQLTAYYERGGFEFQTETRGLSLSLQPTIDTGDELWDAQIGYNFAASGIDALQGLSITLQGQNLTDEESIKYDEVDPRRITQFQTFGTNYLLGARYKF